VRHRCANGVPPVRQRSLPTASSDREPLDSWRTGQSGVVSGVPLKFNSERCALGFLRRETLCRGPAWQRVHRTVRCPKARKSKSCFSADFQIGFRSNLCVSSGVTPSTVYECDCTNTTLELSWSNYSSTTPLYSTAKRE
jgi:hypothetical protein